MDSLYFAPSFYSHIINGLFLLFAFIIVYNNYSNLKKLDVYKILILILLFSISIGVHGISHLGLEKGYSFNPVTLIFSLI
jgi:hypothetical protein